MRIGNTIILLAVALAIGVYIYFYERETPTTDESRKLRKMVLPIKSDDVDKVQITKGETSIICEKNVDGTWEMTHPLKVKADTTQVQGIISRLVSLRKERELDMKPGDAAKYGLEKPRVELRLWHGDAVSEIRVGEEAPLGSNTYLALDDEPKVYLVAKGIIGALDKTVNNLRDKMIVDVAIPRVSRMKAMVEGQETEVIREGDHWKLVSPVRDRADDDKANGILNKLKNLRAVEFVTDEPEDLEIYGLSSPPLEIALFTGEDMAAKKIAFGNAMEEEREKVYAKREGIDTVYGVRKSAVEVLKKDIEKLRSEKIFRAKKGDVEAVTVTHDGDVLEIKKEGNDWKIVRPVEMDAEMFRVDKLLGNITGAKVEEFGGSGEAEERKYGLKEPKEKVTLQLKDGVSERIAIGKTGKKLCYVKREGEEAILGVDKEFENALKTDYLPYVKKDVLSFDRDKVESFTLKRQDREYSCKVGENGEWSSSKPEDKAPEAKELDSIIARLSHIRARSFVEMDGDKLKKYGLEKPLVETEVKLTDGKKYALLIGKECEDGYYAMLRDGRMIFTVPSSLVDSLKVDIVKKKESDKVEESK